MVRLHREMTQDDFTRFAGNGGYLVQKARHTDPHFPQVVNARYRNAKKRIQAQHVADRRARTEDVVFRFLSRLPDRLEQ